MLALKINNVNTLNTCGRAEDLTRFFCMLFPCANNRMHALSSALGAWAHGMGPTRSVLACVKEQEESSPEGFVDDTCAAKASQKNVPMPWP